MIPKIVKINGTGISGLTAELVTATDNVAMFLRNDGYYEVGIIKRAANDYTFPNGHKISTGDFLYWNNEDFGKIAATTKNKDHAYILFEKYNKTPFRVRSTKK